MRIQLPCHLLLAAAILIDIISCLVVFQHDADLCLDEVVNYQCTVTGSPNTLAWRILQEDGTQLGGIVTYGSNGIGVPAIIGGVFSVEQLSSSPSIVSNISFTVQSSVNGYTIICEEFNSNNENFTLTVVNNPGSVTIHTDSFTSSSVNIAWTESPSSCNTIYNYTLSSNDTNDISVMDISGSPTVVNGLVSSYERQYCVVVTAVDFSTRSSDQSCFVFSVPPAVTDLVVNFTRESDTTVDITVSWEEVNFTANGVAVPDFLGYIITIASVSDPDDIIYSSSSSDDTLVMTTSYKFIGILLGATYNITVYSVNGVGRNSTVNDSVVIPKQVLPEPSHTTTFRSSVLHTSASSLTSTAARHSSSMNIAGSSSSQSSETITPTNQGAGSSELNIPAIAGGVAAGVVLILVVVLFPLCCLCLIRRIKQCSDYDVSSNTV